MPELFGGLTLDEIHDAVIQIESSGGKDKRSRYEPNFEKRYGKKWLSEGDAKFRREALAKYGAEAVFSSYGDAQVMYPVAVELGFRGSPQELAEATTNRSYFEKKFKRDWKSSGGKFKQTLLRYNGGGDPLYPDKVMKHLKKQPIQTGALPVQRRLAMERPQMSDMNQKLFRIDKQIKAFERGAGMPVQGLSPMELKQIAMKQNPQMLQQQRPMAPQPMMAQGNPMQGQPMPMMAQGAPTGQNPMVQAMLKQRGMA